MPGDTIGELFRVTVWGESHGPAVGAVIEGCPPGIQVDLKRIAACLERRKPGGSLVSSRREPDSFQILSGVFRGKTTGAPVSIMIKNTGFRSEDYRELEKVFRPGHADYTYLKKYGLRDHRGGGRSSARLTAPVVAAGAIAAGYLAENHGVDILARMKSMGSIHSSLQPGEATREEVLNSRTGFAEADLDREAAVLMEELRQRGDSAGGVVECRATGVPPGLGEPIFCGLDADLGRALMGLNGVKGFEMGSGFKSALITGSANNDEFLSNGGRITMKSNRCGGVLGGISTGMPIVFRAAFKPVPSIGMKQNTVNTEGKTVKLNIKGSHDVCVAVRGLPVVEALTAIVLMDHVLRHRGQCGEK